MTISLILRIIMAMAGVLLLLVTFVEFSKKKITEMVGLGWCLLSVILIVISAVPGLSGWSRVMSGVNYIAFFFVFFIMIIGMFVISRSLSQLIMKNQELAMHVSLLNQENEGLIKDIKQIKQKLILLEESTNKNDIYSKNTNEK